MATVSAVLQPCCTCHTLFVLLARCVVCVLGKSMMMMITLSTLSVPKVDLSMTLKIIEKL